MSEFSEYIRLVKKSQELQQSCPEIEEKINQTIRDHPEYEDMYVINKWLNGEVS